MYNITKIQLCKELINKMLIMSIPQKVNNAITDSMTRVEGLYVTVSQANSVNFLSWEYGNSKTLHMHVCQSKY